MLAAAACGAGQDCTHDANGLCVRASTDAIYSPDRLSTIVQRALTHCQGSEADLGGWHVEFTDDDIDCDGIRAVGCTWLDEKRIVVKRTTCPEQSALAFEVCNAIIGSRSTDPNPHQLDYAPVDICALWTAGQDQLGCSAGQACWWRVNGV